MPDDRFSEDEIRRVFEQAAAAQARAAQDAPAAGLTLDEMAEAGAASGIPRAYIEAAAQAVRVGEPEQHRTAEMGIATGVSRVAFLAGPPSDVLWEALVADARRTFDARGTVAETGRAREWRNGNLSVALAPAGAGSRLDVRSSRGDVAVTLRLTLALAAVGCFAAFKGGAADWGWVPGFLIALMAALQLAAVGLRQRRWAATRDAQMDGLVARATGSAVAAAARSPVPAHTPELHLDALVDALGDAPDVPDEPARRRDRA